VVIVLSTEVLDTTLGPRDELLLLAFGRDVQVVVSQIETRAQLCSGVDWIHKTKLK